MFNRQPQNLDSQYQAWQSPYPNATGYLGQMPIPRCLSSFSSLRGGETAREKTCDRSMSMPAAKPHAGIIMAFDLAFGHRRYLI